MLRVGVLEQAGRASLCLVKNMSSKGVQLKLYTHPLPEAPASIRVADESPVPGQLVWLKGDKAGLLFNDELDTATLLRVQQKLRPNRRRSMPRVEVDACATLRTGGRTFRANVCDISSVGARVRTGSRLVAGDRAMVSLTDLPSISAYVRWTDGDESGLTFETAIPMQILATWVDGRVRLYDARRTRDRMLREGLFGEPAWDMLLALYCLPARGELLTVSALCYASGVPPTTALRWQKTLTDDGLIERGPKGVDRRRQIVRLTNEGRAALEKYLTRLFYCGSPVAPEAPRGD